MKRASVRILALSVLLFTTGAFADVVPPPSARVQHVVIVWLKEHDETARKQYIEATRALAKLPMVLSYAVGTKVPALEREVVDTSYDVAIVATFADAKALDEYLRHPDHAKVLDEKLKPLVDKVIVYDFAPIP